MLVGNRPLAEGNGLAAFLAAIDELSPDSRHLIAVAGPPGSGKSTFSELLVRTLNRAGPDRARILPMDGFHYDDAILEERGQRARKGAPFTFDLDGFDSILSRLRKNDAPEVAVPVFDRAIEISRGAARIIPRAVDIVIVEGNYLLLDKEPWAKLREHFALTVHLDVPLPELRVRLEERWCHYGFSAEEIEAKLEGNDLRNAIYISTNSGPADFRIAESDWIQRLRREGIPSEEFTQMGAVRNDVEP